MLAGDRPTGGFDVKKVMEGGDDVAVVLARLLDLSTADDRNISRVVSLIGTAFRGPEFIDPAGTGSRG